MFHKLRSNRSDPGKIAIAYKLLHDALFVLMIFFLGALIGEGLLPGIVTAHIGLYKILFAILLVILAINLLAGKMRIDPGIFANKKTASVLLLVLAALLFNGMLRISPVLSLSILLTSAAIFYFLYKVIFLEKD